MSLGQINLGDVVFARDRGELWRGGERLQVSQRALDLLGALAANAGKPVSKTELMQAAWPGQIVEEGNLTVQMAALRKAIGEDWIVTVPRVGYRLLKQDAPATKADEPVIMPSLAVLPFANLSGDPEQDYFADGVVEDIITALSRFKSFAVISRNSSFAYKGKSVDVRQVASELGVRYLLEGSVRRAANRLRISTRLLDAKSGADLWAQNFDGDAEDIFVFQDQITESVAVHVAPQILRAEFESSRRERPGSLQAYDLGLQALSKILAETETENAAALVLLEQALALEPDNARLNAYTAYAFEHRITMGWPDFAAHDRERCFAVARRGLEHAAGDAAVMVHCAMALVQVAKEYDWGMAVLSEAVNDNPNNLIVVVGTGVASLHCGTIEQAMSYFQRALRLGPRDPFAHIALCGMAHACMVLGRFEEALDWANKSLAQNQFFDPVFWMLAAANAHLGNLAEAQRHRAALERLSPGMTVAKIKAGQPAKDPTRLAAILEGLRMAGLPEV